LSSKCLFIFVNSVPLFWHCDRSDCRRAAGDSLKGILKTQFGSPEDNDEIKANDRAHCDEKGGRHQRFKQKFYGCAVEGASLVARTDANGEITGVNGEHVDGSCLTTTIPPGLNSKKALKLAIKNFFGDEKQIEIVSDANLSVARDDDGFACFAWKAVIRCTEKSQRGINKVHEDCLHADANTGKARAVFPRVIGFGGYNNDETTLTLQEEDEEDIDAFIAAWRQERHWSGPAIATKTQAKASALWSAILQI
jgi:hypothetical protein